MTAARPAARRRHPHLASAGFALLLAGPAAAQEQRSVVVQGRVVDRATAEPVASATVQLTDAGGMVTDSAGAFRFTGVRVGRHQLTVDAIGYESHDVEIAVRGDTTVVVELDLRPVELDPIDVRLISLRGRIIDDATRRGVIGAEVTAGERSDRTGVAGGYRIRRLPAGQPLVVSVTAFGYEPASWELVAARDTTLNFTLVSDPIAERMIDLEVEKLITRSNAVPHMRRGIDRAELVRSAPWSAWDVIRRHLGTRANRVRCLFIDDLQRFNGSIELEMYLAEELERIELIDNGVMIRIYTRGYIQELVRGRATLRPILLIPTPGGYVCQ